MALRKFNPITPGTRHKVLSKFEDITADKPHKPLLRSLKKSGGRNADGKMTMRYRGGGHKRRYRLIDFKRNKHMEATVLTVEYDPNRTQPHLSCGVQGWREALHHCARRIEARHDDQQWQGGVPRSGQRHVPL
jgi:ribosomal protein L2